MNAQQAIERSRSHNEIVTLATYSEADYETLLAECDGHAEFNGTLEFWGTDWRVHMPEVTDDGPVVREAREEHAANVAHESGAAAEAWWAWHDKDYSRHSATMEEAEQRCASWVAGTSEDGPARRRGK